MNVISAETTFHGTPLGRLTVIVDTNPFNP